MMLVLPLEVLAVCSVVGTRAVRMEGWFLIEYVGLSRLLELVWNYSTGSAVCVC